MLNTPTEISDLLRLYIGKTKSNIPNAKNKRRMILVFK